MESANLTRINQSSALGGIGELILQNGRQAGTRRPLGLPTTFIGRSHGCDVRLNIDGVDPTHCVLIFGPDGLVVRDLDSTHGTLVNGDRVSTMPLRHGDLLKVGPFQFRIELSASAILDSRESGGTADGDREGMHVQVAAVAAQQIALEEEETRLVQRQNDTRQQEEQLATHLAEKQRQVQMWSEHTKAERETLRKQKIEQQKTLTTWEKELNEAKEHLGEEQQRVIHERQRIDKVYQRLRQRWQRQWSEEKQKYQHLAAKLTAANKALEAQQAAVREQEAALAQESLHFNTQRELSTRQLHENWDELKKEQANWRRRQAHERTLAKTRQQELGDTLVKMTEARQLLQQERETWQKQQDSLQKELHGLNNRVVHQRQIIKDQEEKVAALDREVRTRLLHLQRVAAIESAQGKELAAGESTSLATRLSSDRDHAEEQTRPSPAKDLDPDRDRREALERLAAELADQRVHLIEQYKRLAEIQESWSLQREQAAQELETVARKLHDQEQALAGREKEAAGAAQNFAHEREELQTLHQEIQVWRARLKAREQTVEQENQKGLATVRQQEMLLQEQLSGLTYLRQRWNRRRQEEIEHLRIELVQLGQQREEINRLRQDLFAKGQMLEEEKRILAEKTLAVELYRQDVSGRANDPTASRRIERLRRRWLMQNAAQLRHAKREREVVKQEWVTLEGRLAEWTQQMEQLTQTNVLITEQQTALEEREVLLKSREKTVEQEIMQSEAQSQLMAEKYARMKEEVERMAKVVYEASDAPSWPADKAA